MEKELFVVRNKSGLYLCDVEYTVTLNIKNNGWVFTPRVSEAYKTTYEGAKRYAIKTMIAWYAWDVGFDSNDLEIVPLSDAKDKESVE
jgi:hypothetical protein